MRAQKACALNTSNTLPCDLLCHMETASQHLDGRKAPLCAGGSAVGGMQGPLPQPATLNMRQARKNKWKHSAAGYAAGCACLYPMHCLSSGFKSSSWTPGGSTGISHHVQGPTESGKASAYGSTYILNWKIPINYNLVVRLPMGKNYADPRTVSYAIPFYASKIALYATSSFGLSVSDYSQSPWLFLHKKPGLNSPWKGNRAWIQT